MVRVVAILLVVVGAVGFSVPFWFGAVNEETPALEMPLVEISDVAVTRDNRVFFALMPLGRVQSYSADGKFLRSYVVQVPSGSACLAPKADTDAVAGRGMDTLLVSEYWPSRRDTCSLDPPVKSVEWWLTSVTVAFTDGRPPLTIGRAWWHYFALGPFGSFLLLALGWLLLLPPRAMRDW